MKVRTFAFAAAASLCLSMAVIYNSAFSVDGTNPAHAVDTSGKEIPDASTNQPDKPLILSKDSKDPKWGELKLEAAFDHTKHNSDVTHTLDGKTVTACVYCHHTEQPIPVAGVPYLKKSERNAALTAAQLETSKQAVNSCRHCHFQAVTAPTSEFPPASVRYPRDIARQLGMLESGKLTNDNAYHGRCITCHTLATKRDPKLKAPQGCADCHVNKSTTPTATVTPTSAPTARLDLSETGKTKVNSLQVQLLKNEGLKVQVVIQTLKATITRGQLPPTRDQLVAILQRSLSVALEHVQTTEKSFDELRDPESNLAAAKIFFADLQASYKQTLDELVDVQAQFGIETRLLKAFFVKDPRYPALAQATLRVLEQNVLAYNVVADQQGFIFDLKVSSVPAGATVYVWRRGDSEQKKSEPTNSTIPALVYAIWFVRFHAPGYRDEEREHDPFREPNHVVSVELQKS